MSWQRFRGPTAADEYGWCQGCGRRFYYVRLDSKGLCAHCRPEITDDTSPEESEAHTPHCPKPSSDAPSLPTPEVPAGDQSSVVREQSPNVEREDQD